MEKTIKTDIRGVKALTVFWGQYYPEVPVCTHPDCEYVAAEVDAFFPYIDNFNRCETHSLEIIDSRRPVSQCGLVTRRNSPSRPGLGGYPDMGGPSGIGSHLGRISRKTWRPPR